MPRSPQGRRVHVIGAGLAGLAAAVRMAKAGAHVRLYEAAQSAGGRCRSYVDAELGCRVDNGNHLLVSGNEAAMAYVAEIGAAATFIAREMADFPFMDLTSGERWSVRPTDHRFPWWILLQHRRVAGSRSWDYLQALKLRRASPSDTVAAILPKNSILYERLWKPLTVAALNTQPEEASARLLWSLFSETFGRGGAALHALLPREGLSESLVDPALRQLAARGAQISFGHRLRSLAITAGAVASLDFGAKGRVDVAADEAVLLAVNAPVAVELLPDLAAPTEFRGIVNAHYRIEPANTAPHSFLGVIGGTAEWVFAKPGHVSVTISAAEHLIDRAAEDLAQAIWRDVQRALELGSTPMPQWRIVKEKRATFAATPAQLRRRPGPVTPHHNMFLAGDWTDTGWPSTIEGAIRSGFAAAQAIAGQ
ncbi:MAG TPA: hydroxysqualene dehydroxylase HpnE [Dongiaceae bacterium]|nr:hydroxysqualene dehydroxylase HpnE [Dongiaceae bacterium]